jgi:hypothetical protein
MGRVPMPKSANRTSSQEIDAAGSHRQISRGVAKGSEATGSSQPIAGTTASRRPIRNVRVLRADEVIERRGAARRIDNDRPNNPNWGRAGLERAQLELSVITSQLRLRGLLSDGSIDLSHPSLSEPIAQRARRRIMEPGAQIDVPQSSLKPRHARGFLSFVPLSSWRTRPSRPRASPHSHTSARPLCGRGWRWRLRWPRGAAA